MLNLSFRKNKNVLVVGLAKSGYEAAKLLSNSVRMIVNDGKDLYASAHAKN